MSRARTVVLFVSQSGRLHTVGCLQDSLNIFSTFTSLAESQQPRRARSGRLNGGIFYGSTGSRPPPPSPTLARATSFAGIYCSKSSLPQDHELSIIYWMSTLV